MPLKQTTLDDGLSLRRTHRRQRALVTTDLTDDTRQKNKGARPERGLSPQHLSHQTHQADALSHKEARRLRLARSLRSTKIFFQYMESLSC